MGCHCQQRFSNPAFFNRFLDPAMLDESINDQL